MSLKTRNNQQYTKVGKTKIIPMCIPDPPIYKDVEDQFAKLEFMNEEPNEERVKLFKELVTRPGTFKPAATIIMTSNPNSENKPHYIENTKSPYQRLRESEYIKHDIETTIKSSYSLEQFRVEMISLIFGIVLIVLSFAIMIFLLWLTK